MAAKRQRPTSNKRQPKAVANGGARTPEPSAPERSVCVYCGSGPGAKPIYAEAARQLGHGLAAAGIGLVYGGGGMGLMGEVARATLDGGGHVTGIIPKFLIEKEHALTNASELIVTADMHERKKLMFDRSDAFVALPGGIGTLEELVEQLTWSQIGHHCKPIGIVNTGGYWDKFIALLQHMRQEEFIRPGLEVAVLIDNDPCNLVDNLLHCINRTSPSASLSTFRFF
ncbi:MAG: TIGR00730 family Rossman fold protein [Hyphomicrobiaceae bacterium]